MALFDKSHSSSNEDMSKIKEATNQQNTNSNTMNSQEQFVNPFSQNPQSSQTQPSFNGGNLQSPSMQQPTTSQLPSFDNSYAQNTPSFNNNPGFDPSANGGGFSPQMSAMGVSSGLVGGNSEYISRDEVQDMINETIESVIENKWVEITDNVRKVVEWKGKVEDQINLMKEDMVAMQDAFAVLEKRLISKLNNYDKSILDVGSEIKALDKVFQKITPTLVNNVTELGKIAKDLKGVSLSNSKNSSKED